MHKVLVVFTDTKANEQLLKTAKRHATGIDAKLLVCRFADENEYEAELRKASRTDEEIDGVDDVEAAAAAEATAIAEEFFDDVSYTAVGVVGTIPDAVLQVADEHDCNHVFITGRKRSPAGKVLFGDDAQRVILNFDGPVTVTATVD
ncbi:MAG: universal stress protein [Natrinema limicola]